MVNSLNGRIIEELRRRAVLPPKGTANIKNFIKRFLTPDKANATTTALCLINPEVCEGLFQALACVIGGRKDQCPRHEIDL